jgi:DNA-binding NarL/FixJ family response regulator
MACASHISLGIPLLSGAHLTTREVQIARHVAIDWASGDLGRHLGVGLRTIETHLQHVYNKLGVHTRVGLSMLMHQWGG